MLIFVLSNKYFCYAIGHLYLHSIIFSWFTTSEEDLDCEKTEDVMTDIYDDDEARVFHDRGIPILFFLKPGYTYSHCINLYL